MEEDGTRPSARRWSRRLRGLLRRVSDAEPRCALGWTTSRSGHRLQRRRPGRTASLDGGAAPDAPYGAGSGRAGGVRRGREVAAQGPAREAHEVAGAAAVAGAEAARAALRAGQRRQSAGELALRRARRRRARRARAGKAAKR